MQQIKFTSNPHGKLFLNYFMDVRLYDEEKYMQGNILEVVLNNKVLGTAKVVAIKPFKFCNLTDTFSFMNCGKHAAYQASLLEKYYVHEGPIVSETKLMQIIFHWELREMELFEFLLKEWWQKIVDAQPHPFNKNDDHAS